MPTKFGVMTAYHVFCVGAIALVTIVTIALIMKNGTASGGAIFGILLSAAFTMLIPGWFAYVSNECRKCDKARRGSDTAPLVDNKED